MIRIVERLWKKCSSCGKEFEENEEKKSVEIRVFYGKEIKSVEGLIPGNAGLEEFNIAFEKPVIDVDWHTVRGGIICNSCYDANIKTKIPTYEEFEAISIELLEEKVNKFERQEKKDKKVIKSKNIA